MAFFSTLNWYDWFVVAGLVYGIWSGMRSGLSGEIITTAGLVLMVVLAIAFYPVMGEWLAGVTQVDITLANVAAFVGIALVVYLIAVIIKQIVRRKMKRAGFSATIENFGGAAAGVVRWVMIMGWLSVCLSLAPSDFWHVQVGHESRFGVLVIGYFPAVKKTVEQEFPDKNWLLRKLKRREITDSDPETK